MKPRSKLRFWQLSLRTMMLATTLICVATGLYAHWIRPRKLELLVEEFNKAIDDRRYDEACSLGREAKRGYPKNAVAELLLQKGQFARQIATNYEPVDKRFVGTHCYFGDVLQDADDEPVYFDMTKWVELAAKLNRR